MHTVNKNNFHCVYLIIYLLQNYNIKINTSQNNLYKSVFHKRRCVARNLQWWGEAVSALKNLVFFLAKIT